MLAAFRLMVFNVLAHNRDDHVKNFAFIMNDEDGKWTLAPAYDLTFASGLGGEHTMTVAGEGREPKREGMLKLAAAAGIDARQAGDIISEVATAVGGWLKFADQAGIASGPRRKIADAIPKTSNH